MTSTVQRSEASPEAGRSRLESKRRAAGIIRAIEAGGRCRGSIQIAIDRHEERGADLPALIKVREQNAGPTSPRLKHGRSRIL